MLDMYKDINLVSSAMRHNISKVLEINIQTGNLWNYFKTSNPFISKTYKCGIALCCPKPFKYITVYQVSNVYPFY